MAPTDNGLLTPNDRTLLRKTLHLIDCRVNDRNPSPAVVSSTLKPPQPEHHGPSLSKKRSMPTLSRRSSALSLLTGKGGGGDGAAGSGTTTPSHSKSQSTFNMSPSPSNSNLQSSSSPGVSKEPIPLPPSYSRSSDKLRYSEETLERLWSWTVSEEYLKTCGQDLPPKEFRIKGVGNETDSPSESDRIGFSKLGRCPNIDCPSRAHQDKPPNPSDYSAQNDSTFKPAWLFGPGQATPVKIQTIPCKTCSGDGFLGPDLEEFGILNFDNEVLFSHFLFSSWLQALQNASSSSSTSSPPAGVDQDGAGASASSWASAAKGTITLSELYSKEKKGYQEYQQRRFSIDEEGGKEKGKGEEPDNKMLPPVETCIQGFMAYLRLLAIEVPASQ